MAAELTPGDVLAVKHEILSSLHCALPGIVESFDAETQTATVRPALKCHPEPLVRGARAGTPAAVRARTHGEGSPRRSDVSLPLLRDVPVFMPVSFEVNPGDLCLLIFADCDIDAWLETGQAEEPISGRMHSLSDAFAFVGFRR